MSSVPLLDKNKIRYSFSAAAQSYDGLAALQRQVGFELLRRFPVTLPVDAILDLGCGTGFLTRQLADTLDEGSSLLALDIALPMLLTSRYKYPGMAAHYLCADAENLPLVSRSVRQIYSNLALQWVRDLPGAFADFKRVLQADGQLVFATFGPKTLWELKASWATVDDYVHVNSFYSGSEISDFLSGAGFNAIDIQSELYLYDYPSVQALMRELKGIGAHNVNVDRNRKPTTKTGMQRMIDHYQTLMTESRIIASYEIVFVRARG